MNLLTFFILAIYILGRSQAAYIDPFYQFGVWNGWGTHLGWFQDTLAKIPEHVQDKLLQELFSRDRLGLNIVRYPIGATTPGDGTCNDFWYGTVPESYRDGPEKPFLWTRDSLSRKLLLAAKSLGADTFEAVSHSPPSWLTKSKCSQGNPSGEPLHDNFDPTNADTFANYLTEILSYYKTNVGLEFNSIAPFVWPSSGIFTGVGIHKEGCNMERSTMVEVIRSLSVSLKAKGLKCSISVADENSVSEEIKTQNYFKDSNITLLYSKIGAMHTTLTGQKRQAELYQVAKKNKHEIWANDFGFWQKAWPDMTQGLELATGLIHVVKNLMPTAWVYWQPIDYVTNTNWQLMDFPNDSITTENIKFTSGFYALMHFSKYIRKGHTMIYISDSNSIASTGDGYTIIVTVNSEKNAITKSFDFGHFISSGLSITAYQTTSTKPHVAVNPPVMISQGLDINLPPESITTLIITGLTMSGTWINIIKNANFEDVDSNHWGLYDGSRNDNGISGLYPFEGSYSGYLNLTETKLTLMQNLTTAPLSKSVYVSAWCATTDLSNSTFLGMSVNGVQVPEVAIVPDEGYQLYGFELKVSRATEFTVYLRSGQGNHTAQIDNVVVKYCFDGVCPSLVTAKHEL